MAPRTLVLGIPLPHASFDNFSFLSAPSLSEYQQVVVEMSSLSLVVEEVVERTGAHTTYAGQAVVNGDASSYAFGLRELLEMRRRETERLLGGGGLLVLFGHPEAAARNVGGADWRSYSWLPEPEEFSYSSDLLPGFGPPGAVLVDDSHSFAPFVQALASGLAYRLYVNEDAPGFRQSGRVFCRSAGGAAIGFEIAVGHGTLVVLPPLQRPQADRQQTAQVLLECLERRRGTVPHTGDAAPGEGVAKEAQ